MNIMCYWSTGYFLVVVSILLQGLQVVSFILKPSSNKGYNYCSARFVQLDAAKMSELVNDKLLSQVLEVAIDASKKAGDIIIGNAGPTEVTQRKANSRDLLTLIDPLCEKVRPSFTWLALPYLAPQLSACFFCFVTFQVIKETVLASFPDHDFLGEEDVLPGKAASAAALEAKLVNARDAWLWIVGTPSPSLNEALNAESCIFLLSTSYLLLLQIP
jgi:hypothetical protein